MHNPVVNLAAAGVYQRHAGEATEFHVERVLGRDVRGDQRQTVFKLAAGVSAPE
jgi:hypothetical protein